MRLSRRASWFLLVFCLWTWFIWVTLVKNIWADPRSWNHGATGFFIVHVVLAVIDIVCGTGIGVLGWRGIKAHRSAAASAPAPVTEPDSAAAAEAREPERSESR
jgi:hypothetical protein